MPYLKQKTDRFGLSDEVLGLLRAAFAGYGKVDAVVVFGSRAMGNHRPGSDIDLAVKGGSITSEDMQEMVLALDNLGLLYKVDVRHYDTINNADLKAHVDRVGIDLYNKG